MFKTALLAVAILASAAFAAGCGDDSPMMMGPGTDGGMIDPPPPVPPTPVPPTPVPTPVPPPPMDGGVVVSNPSVEDPLCLECQACECDQRDIQPLLEGRPHLSSSSTCSPGVNSCGLDLPSDMTYLPAFPCQDNVLNDLWVVDGAGSEIWTGGYPDFGGNGQLKVAFGLFARYTMKDFTCTGSACYSNWRLMDEPGDMGNHLRVLFSADCSEAIGEIYGTGMQMDDPEAPRIEARWVDHCGDGVGDCP